MAPGQHPAASNVLNKETRHAVLNYFIFRPPEEEKRESSADEIGGVGEQGGGDTATTTTTTNKTTTTSGRGGGNSTSGSGGGATPRIPSPRAPPLPPYVSPRTYSQLSAKWKEDGCNDRGAGDIEVI